MTTQQKEDIQRSVEWLRHHYNIPYFEALDIAAKLQMNEIIEYQLKELRSLLQTRLK